VIGGRGAAFGDAPIAVLHGRTLGKRGSSIVSMVEAVEGRGLPNVSSNHAARLW
jgi:hypothetical protein